MQGNIGGPVVSSVCQTSLSKDDAPRTRKKKKKKKKRRKGMKNGLITGKRRRKKPIGQGCGARDGIAKNIRGNRANV